ncbi:MAG: hypothetical protein J0I87_03330 [Cellulomonas sp.]|nr:hypothetical protein [Cellulomonas sp.]
MPTRVITAPPAASSGPPGGSGLAARWVTSADAITSLGRSGEYTTFSCPPTVVPS